jgi:hypothetical protein
VARLLKDWLTSYCEYVSYTEAPRKLHFWAGVSAIAGALRRKVWIDQVFFRWYPNFYIILVAPPGIAQKSTTVDNALNLLHEVPGIHFGPEIVTWQALVTAFASSTETFEFKGKHHLMSSVTCVASELGNLLNPREQALVDLLITLWDGKKRLRKETKMSGSDTVQNIWANLIGCTTPHWIASNVPQVMVGGGLTSRMIFAYADQKEKTVAYLKDKVPSDHQDKMKELIHDLDCIAKELTGEYELLPDAIEWGTRWYDAMWKSGKMEGFSEDQYGGYLARKQTHVHKTAMVLAASARNELYITAEDLMVADRMLVELEPDIPKVFSKIGKSLASVQTDRFLEYLKRRGIIPYNEAYRYMHAYFPDLQGLEGIIAGVIKAGYAEFDSTTPNGPWLRWLK